MEEAESDSKNLTRRRGGTEFKMKQGGMDISGTEGRERPY